jgi:hypothetical protein
VNSVGVIEFNSRYAEKVSYCQAPFFLRFLDRDRPFQECPSVPADENAFSPEFAEQFSAAFGELEGR